MGSRSKAEASPPASCSRGQKRDSDDDGPYKPVCSPVHAASTRFRTRCGDGKTLMQAKEEPKAESEAALDIFESLVQRTHAAKASSKADRVSHVASGRWHIAV